MLAKRIITCLDVKEGRTVKGVHFNDLKDAGDIVELAKKYSVAGADELVFLDITASNDQPKEAAISRKTMIGIAGAVLPAVTDQIDSHSFSCLVLKAVNRSRNPSGSAYKFFTAECVHWHDRRMS